MAAGATDDAVLALQAASRAFKRSAPIWVRLGALLASLGRDEEALGAYRESTWLIARDADVWVVMAILAHRLEKTDEALSCWKNALKARPELFRERSAFVALWNECRQPEAEFAKLACRLVPREDTSAAIGFLDEVLLPQEAATALRCCRALAHGPNVSFALQVAVAALSASSATPAGLYELSTVAQLEAPGGGYLLSDEELTRVLACVRRIADEQWDKVVGLGCEIGETRFVRAFYAMPTESSLATLHAVTAMAQNIATIVRLTETQI